MPESQSRSTRPSLTTIEYPHCPNCHAAATPLTRRERQIVRLVSEALSNKEIGRRLNVADGTIKVHLHNIFEKLQISNRTALVAVYFSRRDKAGEQSDHEW